MSNLDAAIEEINRVLICNKSREVEEVYLLNAVRYINEFKKQPELNENQQIVLDWLKREQIKRSTLDILIIRELAELIYHGYFSEELVYKAFMEINRKQQAQVLQAFTQWSLEQEEAE